MDEKKGLDLLSKIGYKRLRDDIKKNLKENYFEQFSDLLKIEEEFLLEKINPEKGIGRNQLIKENLFLLFLAVVTKIPLIIFGKPGTGKSLSAQLISNSMQGQYSKDIFFTNYPQITQLYFQGSDSTTPAEVEELFKNAENLYKISKMEIEKRRKLRGDSIQIPIYMILFDELGLAEKSSTNPLKVLHSKLEYGGQTEGTCFIGISNYSLDAAKINRALSLSVSNLEDHIDQLKDTAKSIVESISNDIYQDNLIFDIICRAYERYKYYLNLIKKLVVLKQYAKENNIKGKDFAEIENDQEYIKLIKKERKIKTEFHGNRDFYYLIRGIANVGSRLTNFSEEIVPIINKYIERNFGGITYNLDINFDLEFTDIQNEIKTIKDDILKEKLEKNEKEVDDSEEEEKQKKDNEELSL